MSAGRTIRPLALLHLGAAGLLMMAGCADRTAPLRREIAELKRKLEAASSESLEDKARIEELNNRVLILQDKLETQELAAARAVPPPRAPVVRVQPPPAQPARRTESVLPMADEADVEYLGAARDTHSPRPVLRIEGPNARRVMVRTETAVEPMESRPRRTARAATPRSTVAAAGERLPVVPLPDRGVPAARTEHRTRAAASTPNPASAYTRALEALRRRAHAEAIAAFRAFLAQWPHHDLSDNAQYWLGEAFYDQQDYKTALAEFRKVLQSYPGGNKAPDALLKAGFCQARLGALAEARTLLGQVIELYPKTRAARLATERLGEMR